MNEEIKKIRRKYYCHKCIEDNKRMCGLKKYGNYCPRCWEKIKPKIKTYTKDLKEKDLLKLNCIDSDLLNKT